MLPNMQLRSAVVSSLASLSLQIWFGSSPDIELRSFGRQKAPLEALFMGRWADVVKPKGDVGAWLGLDVSIRGPDWIRIGDRKSLEALEFLE